MIDQGENTSPQVRLAYKFDIYATSPVSRGDLYIDATTGAHCTIMPPLNI
jgi:hypothetical protein